MSLFVPTSMFPIDIKYVEVKLKNGLTGHVIIDDDDKEALEKYKGKIQELHTQWAQPGWKENYEVVRASFYWDEFRGVRDVDYHTYRALCIDKFLKSWDAVDDNNKPVPCTVENIARMDIQITYALATKFLARNIPTEEDLKNLLSSPTNTTQAN